MNVRPLVLDLYCGRGGWTRGFLARGFRVIGFDIIRHTAYPQDAEFVLQDARQVNGRKYRGAVLVVASPPCREFTLQNLPWIINPPKPQFKLVEAAIRIACEAAAPLILENVRNAQPFLGKATAHYGPFYLWGDGVPALIPHIPRERLKEKFSSSQADLRAEIPFHLAASIASVYAQRRTP